MEQRRNRQYGNWQHQRFTYFLQVCKRITHWKLLMSVLIGKPELLWLLDVFWSLRTIKNIPFSNINEKRSIDRKHNFQGIRQKRQWCRCKLLLESYFMVSCCFFLLTNITKCFTCKIDVTGFLSRFFSYETGWFIFKVSISLVISYIIVSVFCCVYI